MRKILILFLLSYQISGAQINVDSLVIADTAFANFIAAVDTASLNTIPTWDSIFLYKDIGWKNLYMRNYRPVGTPNGVTIVLYHGGGWVGGLVDQHKQYAYWLSQHGYNCFGVQYRLINDSSIVTPYFELEDVRSSIRYLREHAADLNISDTSKIIAGGMSAGGHLAAAAAYIHGYENPYENLSISSKPNGLILQNSVIDISKKGYLPGHNLIGCQWKAFSPLQNIDSCLKFPSIVLNGTADVTTPFIGMVEWDSIYISKGCTNYFYSFPDRIHGFGNYASSQSGVGHRDFYYSLYLIWKFLETEF